MFKRDNSKPLMLRLPPSLYDATKKASQDQGVNLNQYVIMVLAEAVDWSIKQTPKNGADSQPQSTSDVRPAQPESRKETIPSKSYGERARSYMVNPSSKPGWIRLYVCHRNETVRDMLRSHQNNPQFFVEHLETYKKGHFRAYAWLANVIEDYMEFWVAGRVEIIVDANCDSLRDPMAT
jgi:hypothetical protein